MVNESISVRNEDRVESMSQQREHAENQKGRRLSEKMLNTPSKKSNTKSIETTPEQAAARKSFKSHQTQQSIHQP